MNPDNKNNTPKESTSDISSVPQQNIDSVPIATTPDNSHPAKTVKPVSITSNQNNAPPVIIPTNLSPTNQSANPLIADSSQQITPIENNIPTPQASEPLHAPSTQPNLNSAQPNNPAQIASPGIQLSNNPEPKGKKSLKTAVIAVVTVLALVIIAGVAFTGFKIIGGGDYKYSQRDLKPYKARTYSINYPSKYMDYSNDPAVKSSFNDVSNLGFFGIKSKTAKDKFTSLIVTGSVPLPITEKQLNLLLNDKQYIDTKNQFDAESKQALNDLIYQACIEPKNVKLTTGKNDMFTVYFNIQADCMIDNLEAHIDATLGAKNNDFFVLLLATKKTDWSLNQQFYQDYVLKSFKAL